MKRRYGRLMTDYSPAPARFRNRLLICGLVILIVIASVVTGTQVMGDVDASVKVVRTPYGPISLSLTGGVGDKPAQPSPQVRSSPVNGTPPPYYGPTREEQAALNELRGAVQIAWKRTQTQMQGAGGPDAPSMPIPEIELPARHLTPFELNEIRRSAARLRAQ